jgi:CIC family chloride channel protein
VTATIFRGLIIGPGALFPIASTPVPSIPVLLFSVVVGICCGALSTILTYMVYSAEDAFRRLPIHWMWWPAIGAIAIGVGGFFAPHALGVGYDTIGLLLGSPNWIVGVAQISMSAIIILLIAKSIMWSVALGSGTSGGVLAPLLIMGGSLGAILSLFAPAGVTALWVLVSMGAVLGGTMRSPFTGVIFSLELTHDVNALFPLLIAALFSEFVTVFTMKRSILTEKVARRGVHVAREYSVDVLELIPVRSVMHRDVHSIEADAPLDELVKVVKETGRSAAGYPVVDAIGNLQGFLTRSDVLEYLAKVPSGMKLKVRELVKSPVVVAFPDEPLRVAADRMAMIGSDSIPVVDTINDQKVVGLVSREDLFNARVLWFVEEKQRESFLSLPVPPINRLSFSGITRVIGKRKQKRSTTNEKEEEEVELSDPENNDDEDDDEKDLGTKGRAN